MPGLLGLGAILDGGAAVAGVGLQVWDYISNSDQRRIQNEVMAESSSVQQRLAPSCTRQIHRRPNYRKSSKRTHQHCKRCRGTCPLDWAQAVR